jgi:hypothetical protein
MTRWAARRSNHAAAAGGPVPGRQLVAVQRWQRRRKQVRLDPGGERELALELRPGELGGLMQRLQPLALLCRQDCALEQPRVLDRRRRLQRQRVHQLQLGGRVRHGRRAAERDDADDPLAHLERRGEERLDRRVLDGAPRIPVHVVDDFADPARRHGADDASPQSEAGQARQFLAEAGHRLERPGPFVEQHHRAVGCDNQVAGFAQREFRDALDVEQPPASRRSCRSG